jgi:hypothetical protein
LKLPMLRTGAVLGWAATVASSGRVEQAASRTANAARVPGSLLCRLDAIARVTTSPPQWTGGEAQEGSPLQGTVPAAERSARHRNVVARVRGDGGFLDGFAFGQPVALSRAPVGPPLGAGISLVQNFNGPITSGSNINQVFAGPGSTIASQLVVCGDAGEDRESPVDGVRIALVCDGSSNVAITDHEGSGRGP